ncbi:hypothetical protein B711_0817 [Chlamydia psittaci CP3]|nr:hypothetical protein B599_0761 [Chlamydia psittaci MN]AFS27207.1 hypothetical protein B711_0817 [Chlamydia psittaci CP3]EPJ25698.1 hypothetical protein CP09DC77_0092 [Chlamydia psittaci 09DC77]EPJ27252.1 hypothetical protein CP09DC80_0090 [Chlamydia psittaci 09DC80]EPJ30771.1 hypothetical protein CP09DC78_0090 [Chlamydia psittaci 09DC78]EPL00734.1 hypothetical protein CP09DC79_0895 [Chlamydia psittaci 09DC79]
MEILKCSRIALSEKALFFNDLHSKNHGAFLLILNNLCCIFFLLASAFPLN